MQAKLHRTEFVLEIRSEFLFRPAFKLRSNSSSAHIKFGPKLFGPNIRALGRPGPIDSPTKSWSWYYLGEAGSLDAEFLIGASVLLQSVENRELGESNFVVIFKEIILVVKYSLSLGWLVKLRLIGKSTKYCHKPTYIYIYKEVSIDA